MSPHIRPGVWSVLATPFSGSTLQVDEAGVARLAEHAAASDVSGLTVLGVFGEAARLSWAERRLVLEAVLAATDLPLVVGCTGTATAPVVDEARMATELVGDRLAGVMVQANTADRIDLLGHLSTVNESTSASIVIQDYPATTGVSVPTAVLCEAATRPYVAAVKAEAPPTSATVAQLAQQCQTPVFGGLGGVNLLDELACGAAGAMTGFSYPEALVACVRAWDPAMPSRSRAALLDYLPLITFEQQQGIALAIRKECLRRRGIISDSVVRPPARSVPEALLPVLAEHITTIENGV